MGKLEHVTSKAIEELLDVLEAEERESHHGLKPILAAWIRSDDDFNDFFRRHSAKSKRRNRVRKWLLTKLFDVLRQEFYQEMDDSAEDAKRRKEDS